MMKKRHILHWAMGVVMTPLLGSCAADDVVGDAGREGCDIILGQPMAVTSVTRATDGSTSSNQFKDNEIVWLWAIKNGSSTEHITAWKLTAQSGGNLSGSSTKYWPSDGSKLDVYALHGNFKNSSSISEGTTQWSSLTALTHTVETNQSSDENKRLSDLLYSQALSAASGQTVQLTFDHELSKICIVLQKYSDSGIQEDDLKKATVQVSDIYTEVTYNTTTRDVTTSGTPTTITLGQETSGSTTYEAIVPSNMTVNNPHVTITLNNFPETGKTRTFSCDLSSVTFAKGNKYTFTLTLHNEIVVSEPTVKGWIEDTESVTIPQVTPD